MIDQFMVTTNIELSGYRVTRNLGVVRGITVRSRSILGNIAGGFQTLLVEQFQFTSSSVRKRGKKHFSKCCVMPTREGPMPLSAQV
jgi:uncharacterized protein YbjQ (UPF0145 family)